METEPVVAEYLDSDTGEPVTVNRVLVITKKLGAGGSTSKPLRPSDKDYGKAVAALNEALAVEQCQAAPKP